MQLLEELENFIWEQSKAHFSMVDADMTKNYTIIISETIGDERFTSTTEIRTQKFSDSTNSIKMQLSDYHAMISLSIRFHTKEMFSDITIDMDSEHSRERALGYKEGICRIIEGSRTSAWVFHPNPWIQGGIFALLPFIVGGAIGAAFTGASKSATTFFATSLFIYTTFIIGMLLNPYVSFHSRRSEVRERIWMWFLPAMATFLVFGLLLSFLGDRLFGA